jgi:putative ABC transport system substrate-binding protein
MPYTPIFRIVVALAIYVLAPFAMAQAGEKIARIGYLSLGPGPSPRSEALHEGLRDLGYVENKNYIIVYKWANESLPRLQNAASELVRSKVDVIVTGGPAATLAAHKATSTIPIVMAGDYDPVAAGFVTTLAHPGQNITGLSVLNPQLSGKRLELLKEMNPRLAAVAVFFNPAEPNARSYLRETQSAAAAMGMQLDALEIRSAADLEGAFQAARKAGAKAIAVLTDYVTLYNRANLVALAAKHRVPVIYTERLFVEAGGLVSYGASDRDLHRRAAAYVDRILKGSVPADIPVEQPTKFELVISRSAAKSIDLQVPTALLLRADVIE